MTETKRAPKPPPAEDRLVPVTIFVPPRAYDAFCREAGAKRQSLSAFLRTALAKNRILKP